MRRCHYFPMTLVLMLATVNARAQEYGVAALQEAAPADALSPEIAAELADSGLRVQRGGSRTLCDVWLRKSWTAKPGFELATSVIYPLEAGELVGVIRFPRKAADFRGQEIPKGVYTLRYAWQPVDGNHVGTSDTRDFLLMLPAAEDRAVSAPEEKQMFELSASVAGSTHPAMLCLLTPDEAAETPGMVHNEERNLWSVRVPGTATSGADSKPFVLQIVVVGKAEG